MQSPTGQQISRVPTGRPTPVTVLRCRPRPAAASPLWPKVKANDSCPASAPYRPGPPLRQYFQDIPQGCA
ncbi:hypothetical protein GN956_G21257 [Arapaima gigas]